jgi:hypothetical protein
LVLLGTLGLATGYGKTVLTMGIIMGLVTLLRGYVPARSSSAWAEGNPEFDELEVSDNAAVRWYAKSAPAVALLNIIIFGVSLAAFLMDTKMFMVGMVGMVVSGSAFFLMLKR